MPCGQRGFVTNGGAVSHVVLAGNGSPHQKLGFPTVFAAAGMTRFGHTTGVSKGPLNFWMKTEAMKGI